MTDQEKEKFEDEDNVSEPTDDDEIGANEMADNDDAAKSSDDEDAEEHTEDEEVSTVQSIVILLDFCCRRSKVTPVVQLNK